ncbi:glutamate ABC transporter substrate-binding protein [Phytohabitans kaempferiae]|uniref:Transporter substrate-binding domain-containing protein n=1 Tax=Phytohabitans kaempferiae TaxID=1620943 RepID=A0ABV6LWW9_9ACTN
MSKRTSVRAAAAVLAALVLAGCGGTEPLPSGPDPAEPARPVGVQDPAVLPTSPVAPAGSCDPRASFRPTGALPPAGRMPSGSTMARIQRAGRLVVGVDQNNYRFGYRDSKTGNLVGFEIDLARELARAIFGSPDKVLFRTITTADREAAIQEGRVDIVIRSMTMNCDRWERIAFSTEYFSAGQAILVAGDSPINGIEDLAGKKVCAATGSTSIRNIAAKAPDALPVSASDALDCLVLLQQLQVEAVSTDDAILAGFAEQDKGTKILPERFTEEPYGMAMKQGATDLVRFVNGVLDQLRSNGTWTRVYETWLSSLGDTPPPPAPRYRD